MRSTNYTRFASLVLVIFATLLEGLAESSRDFIDPLPRIVRVHEPSHQFLDEFNRTRWFHGTNVVKKSFPWHPDTECAPGSYHFCDEDMDYLKELGVNAVRLGVMWAGAEPTRGEYNYTYFQVTHGIIQRLAERGIYTLVDVHQDVMAKQTCGEGFPDWFMEKGWVQPGVSFPVPQQLKPFTTDEQGIPDPWEQCNTIKDWFISYLTVASGNAWGRMYNNHNNLSDSFADYWKEIASQYRNYSSVLGYDLLNEPWAGDIYADPTLLVPGVADEKVLDPLWQKCNERIREVDSETLIFFEGVTWDIRDRHPTVPGGDGSKTAMSYHYYAPPQFGLHTTYQNRLKDQDRLKTGGMLTEFRMWLYTDDNEAVRKEMRDTVDLADLYLQSWMGWEYSSIWGKYIDIEKHYARTYAPAVAGFVKAMGFNEDTGDYFITWEMDPSITEPTEIKINKRIYYPDGYEVTVSPGNAITWKDLDGQNLELKYGAGAVFGQNVTVEISPKTPTTEAYTGGAATSAISISGSLLWIVGYIHANYN